MTARHRARQRTETLDTREPRYTARLFAAQSAIWKRALNVQAPYRWNLRRLDPGFTLDVGCGIGRNLINLGGQGVGIDHNSQSVDIARSRGLTVFTPQDFEASPFNLHERFDSILLTHVAEHMTQDKAAQLLHGYIPLLKRRGRVILITPQEAGYRSDPSHVHFTDFAALRDIAREAGLMVVREYSFPFPRMFGRWFKHNEFVSVSEKPAERSDDHR